jgi:hypothetical protein
MLACYITGLYPRDSDVGRTSMETSNYIKTLLSINLLLPLPPPPPRAHSMGWGESIQQEFLKLWKPVFLGLGEYA